MTKRVRVSVIVVYPLLNQLTDILETSEFYIRILKQIDRVWGRNIVFLLGDFKARNTDRWYPSLGKFGLG